MAIVRFRLFKLPRFVYLIRISGVILLLSCTHCGLTGDGPGGGGDADGGSPSSAAEIVEETASNLNPGFAEGDNVDSVTSNLDLPTDGPADQGWR